MPLDIEYQKLINTLMRDVLNKKISKDTIINLIKSKNIDSWKCIDQILTFYHQKNLTNDYDDMVNLIDKCYQINSFTMLLYLYNLKSFVKKYTFLSHIRWHQQYTDIALRNGQLMTFSAQISNQPKSKIVQQTILMVCQSFVTMYKKERLFLTQYQVSAIIEWITLLETGSEKQFQTIMELCKIVHECPIKISNDFTKKQHLILNKLIETAGQYENCSANIFVFVYPFILEQKDISYFCHLNSETLKDLSEEYYVNFFKALTKSAISKQIVHIITKLCELLRGEQQFFKLRVIFQKFILPILIARAKSCLKLENKIFELAQTFILGFLNHCNLGQNGISYCLKNFGKIQNKQVLQKWLQLFAVLAKRYPNLKILIQQGLQRQMKTPIKLPEIKYDLLDSQIVWQVSDRNSRKHKHYIKVPSKMKGIQNNGNQCYIISTVQALLNVEFLQKLLNNYRGQIKFKKPLLDEIRTLFLELRGQKNTNKVRVTYLKQKGPKQFFKSLQQQDVQQYIIQIFENMEQQMSQIEGLLDKFKTIFQSTMKISVKCQKCKKCLEKQESVYTYTIYHTQVLSKQTEQKINQYQCSFCHKPNSCTVIRQLVPTSQVLTVHINRFSHRDGKTKKQLYTSPILRYFLNYQLVGIICHIGKTVQQGHYLFYSKISAKRWAKFNDLQVEEFELDDENEEFQKQMKAQTTPYILFYKIK